MQGDIFKADVHKSGQEWSRKLNTGIFWRRTLHHTVSSRHACSSAPQVPPSCGSNPVVILGEIRHAVQVVVISDPVLAAEVLDRSKCPDFIDKPSDPMFYKAFDEVTCLLHHFVCISCTEQWFWHWIHVCNDMGTCTLGVTEAFLRLLVAADHRQPSSREPPECIDF